MLDPVMVMVRTGEGEERAARGNVTSCMKRDYDLARLLGRLATHFITIDRAPLSHNHAAVWRRLHRRVSSEGTVIHFAPTVTPPRLAASRRLRDGIQRR